MEQRSNFPKLAVEGLEPYFIEFNTGVYLSRKAVNEGTELAFDLEERENIDSPALGSQYSIVGIYLPLAVTKTYLLEEVRS